MMSAERKDSGDSSSGEDPIPVNKFNPAEIRTDGSGTTLKGERSSFVIEIIDPGQKSAPPATSLEQMHVAPGDDLLDNIMKRYMFSCVQQQALQSVGCILIDILQVGSFVEQNSGLVLPATCLEQAYAAP